MPRPLLTPASRWISLLSKASLILAAGVGAGAVFPAATPSRPAAEPGIGDRIQLQVVTDEAEAVLGILARRASGGEVGEKEWLSLFSTEGYVRLKKREASMHRDLIDADFEKFVLSPDLAAGVAALRRTLDAWKKADLMASARRVLAYLPPEARIRARVYPVIKPQTNSFVFEPATDAAIFLYLDPKESGPQFENTVAHELHHIGFASLGEGSDATTGDATSDVKAALDWMGAFGEGFAMLAAAGGPEVHPHAVSEPEERARWDRDTARFDEDLKSLEKFFLDILDGRLKTDEEIQKVGFTFFGVQGPWYTVGYKMAVTIEKRFGRPVLIECMRNPRELLARYNEAVKSRSAAAGGSSAAGTGQATGGSGSSAKGSGPAIWSAELLKKIGAEKTPS